MTKGLHGRSALEVLLPTLRRRDRHPTPNFADLSTYPELCDSVSQESPVRFLKDRINDPRMIRYSGANGAGLSAPAVFRYPKPG